MNSKVCAYSHSIRTINSTCKLTMSVCEIGRGRSVQERRLEILQRCCGGEVEGGDGDRKPVCKCFWKKMATVYLVT